MTGWVADGLFATLFPLAAIIVVASKPQRFIVALLAIVASFCVLDQTRWQPWVFLYSALLLTLALFSWESADAAGARRALNVARLIIAFTYVFSGLQKANSNFMTNGFPWIAQPITKALPSTTYVFQMLAPVAPFAQMAFGLGLLTREFRRASLIAAIAMHLFILAMLGPTGLDWNNVIWPWTAAMAVFDVLLFTGKVEETGLEILRPSRPFHAIALLAFAVLPLLSFFNLWDSYLSAALYSGNLTEAEIYLTDAGKASLPAPIGERALTAPTGASVINLQRWAIEDLNVTPYPETRVFKAIARKICGRLPDPAQLVLIIREQRMFRSKPETGYRCWEV
ncbi:MAG TPA: hypothetical protein VKS78_15110 [Roseiarcus sp.]|nr:hypothetical protein [Roseiarcus sp.]